MHQFSIQSCCFKMIQRQHNLRHISSLFLFLHCPTHFKPPFFFFRTMGRGAPRTGCGLQVEQQGWIEKKKVGGRGVWILLAGPFWHLSPRLSWKLDLIPPHCQSRWWAETRRGDEIMDRIRAADSPPPPLSNHSSSWTSTWRSSYTVPRMVEAVKNFGSN